MMHNNIRIVTVQNNLYLSKSKGLLMQKWSEVRVKRVNMLHNVDKCVKVPTLRNKCVYLYTYRCKCLQVDTNDYKEN